MTTAVQNRRGTTAEHSTFTGLEGEVTIDTTKDTAVIHDGVLAGGYPLAKENLANVSVSGLSALTGAGTASDDKFFVYDQSATSLKTITRAELNNAMEADALANVTITGGTIDGTTIGGTTAAAGTFTNLTATTSATLQHSASTKLATTSTGIDVTGTITSDGLTVDGSGTAQITSTSGTTLELIRSGTAGQISSIIMKDGGNVQNRINSSGGELEFEYGASNLNALKIANNGDISFYEDTGTTPKFFWDASAESLTVPVLATTGNTTLGDASTDTVTVNGYMGVGGAGNAAMGVRVIPNALTGAAQYGIVGDPTGTNAASTLIAGVWGRAQTAAAAYTTSDLVQFYAAGSVKGAGSTITNQHGLYIADQTQGTNNYGITSLVSSGTNKWNIYASGTAANYFAGNVGIGTSSPDASRRLHVYNTASSMVGNMQTNTTGAFLGFTDSTTTDNTYVRFGAIGNAAVIYSGGSERLHLNSAGNLGLGVTPSAWGSGAPALQIGATGSLHGFGSPISTSAYVGLSSNVYTVSGSQQNYISTQAAASYSQYLGAHRWYTAASGTADTAISWNQAMTLDASGNLGIGTSSPGGARLAVIGSATSGYMYVGDGTANMLIGTGATLSSDSSTPYLRSAGAIGFATGGGTERARIDSSGNVGIGTSSPSAKLHVSGQSRVADSSNAANYMTFGVGANAPYGNASISTTTAGLAIVAEGAGNMTFLNNGSERARIDSSGNLLVGTTSAGYSDSNSIMWQPLTLGAYGIINHATGTSSGREYIHFAYAGVKIGSITQNGTTATAYNTSSDYRLKENVVGVTGASARVQQLNPVRFNFIADPDTTVDGFLAHEVQDVVPEAITGTKDAVDAEGNPVYQGIDQSKLVPLLTAALQEALAEIESLKARLDAANL